MNIDNLKVYELSMELGEKVWKITLEWGFFEKDTINSL